MKKLIAILIVALLACTVASALAAGQVRTTASVNLREGPGLDYAKIDAVGPGTVLEYLGETSTDARGVDWYRVSFEGASVWISSRYSELAEDAGPSGGDGADEDEAAVIEVSGWYLYDLVEVAEALGADSYAEVNSEVPNQYSNDALTVAGGEVAEYFGVRGEGYSLFGVTVGMDIETARQRMADAGLSEYAGGTCVTFRHPADEHSIVNSDGYDSCVNIFTDQDGRVIELDWSTYSG